MWVRANREGQGLAVEPDRLHTAAGRANAITHPHRAAEQLGVDSQPVECARDHRVDDQDVRLAIETEEAADDEPQPDARAARVHTPSPLEIDHAFSDALVFGARLISIVEGGVGARVVALRLTQ